VSAGAGTGRRDALLRAGFVADGVFKLATAALYVALAGWFATRLHAPAALVVGTAAVLALCGAAEIALARTGAVRRSTRLLVAYDLGWAVVTVGAVLLAWSETPGGGVLWFAYQPVAAAGLGAAALAALRRERGGG
jgi:hypothetical protein